MQIRNHLKLLQPIFNTFHYMPPEHSNVHHDLYSVERLHCSLVECTVKLMYQIMAWLDGSVDNKRH